MKTAREALKRRAIQQQPLKAIETYICQAHLKKPFFIGMQPMCIEIPFCEPDQQKSTPDTIDVFLMPGLAFLDLGIFSGSTVLNICLTRSRIVSAVISCVRGNVCL